MNWLFLLELSGSYISCIKNTTPIVRPRWLGSIPYFTLDNFTEQWAGIVWLCTRTRAARMDSVVARTELQIHIIHIMLLCDVRNAKCTMRKK